MTKPTNHDDARTNAGGQGAVSGFLAAALNMEDQISKGVYEEYRNRASWPDGLDEETFEQIKTRLTTLIEDTNQHAKILRGLAKDYV